MKWFNRQTITAFILGAILFSSIGVGAATLYQFSISTDILYVNGTKVDKLLYKYQDTNYLPLRAVSETLGLDVGYNSGRIDLTRKEPTTAEIVAKVYDACVMINTYKDGALIGQGSGVLVDKYIITAYHVVDGGDTFNIIYSNGWDFNVYNCIGIDEKTDVAILESPYTPATVEMGDSDKVVIGDKIVTVSSPKGRMNTVSEGIISNLATNNNVKYISIDSETYPGSSGGGVFNIKGELIGIVYGGYYEKLSSATPINYAKEILDAIK
jgi:S1-C subfamily serine protease